MSAAKDEFMHLHTRLKKNKTDFFVAVVVLVLSYLPTPPLGQDMTQGQFLSGV